MAFDLDKHMQKKKPPYKLTGYEAEHPVGLPTEPKGRKLRAKIKQELAERDPNKLPWEE